MLKGFGRYLERCGMEFDIAVNVLLGGQLGQTVSYRCAVAQREGKAWGRFMCWFLNWAVQRNHCALQFTRSPTLGVTCLRAGIAFSIAIAAVAGMADVTMRLISHTWSTIL